MRYDGLTNFLSQARAALAKGLTGANVATEVAYLRGAGRASFERPYGLAWLLQLAAELRGWNDPQAREWLRALAPLETDWHKPFLEIAPALIVVFKQDYGLDAEGRHVTHYYVNESVGIACGFLLAALTAAGLATLTHTPSPMGFLREILGRPKNEKPYLLIPVGYPAEGCRVPDLAKKDLQEILIRVGC